MSALRGQAARNRYARIAAKRGTRYAAAYAERWNLPGIEAERRALVAYRYRRAAS